MIDSHLNYFTAIEEHLRCARGTTLFRLSPRDWDLIDKWRNAAVPLEAVLRGIDVAFEKWRRHPVSARTQKINSLAYCAQAVAAEAQAMANASLVVHQTAPPFTVEAVCAFVGRNAAAVRRAGLDDFAKSLESLDLQLLYTDLAELDQRLTVIEDQMIARLRTTTSEDTLVKVRRDLDRELNPYRRAMTADQLAILENQFLGRRLLEAARLPRLSLFYLR
jgi:hypothetical protein